MVWRASLWAEVGTEVGAEGFRRGLSALVKVKGNREKMGSRQRWKRLTEASRVEN